MFTFLYPGVFLFIVPVIILVVFLYFQGLRRVDFGPLKDLQKFYKKDTLYFKIYNFLLLLIFFVFITILSGPVVSETKENIKKNGIDIQIVLDVSLSMIAEDLKPNRLEVAKGVIYDFLNTLKTDRVGLVIFAGKPFISLPLNFDYNISKKIVDKISVSTINQNSPHLQGTAVGDALLLATDSFDDKSKQRGKVIVLITDGEANKGLNPLIGVEYVNKLYKNSLNKEKIKVYTIGIGGSEKTFILYKHPFAGTQKVEISGVDEETLKTIASKTGGEYFRATDKKSLEKIFENISKLEKKEIEVESIEVHKSKNIYFVSLLMILFLLLFLLKLRKNII
ncbi:VWA domain-containing protein [Candidatus Gracilibacteria bacterium 28_42_T64]|nr:VWA domain-containing protein [Candidatus Gracilibacteria bacterium 28_42_T64]